MGFPYGGDGWSRRFGDQEISQFHGAEMIAEKWGITRDAMEEFALESHRRALAAADSGWFADEIAPYAGVVADEGPRPDRALGRDWPSSSLCAKAATSLPQSRARSPMGPWRCSSPPRPPSVHMGSRPLRECTR